MKMQITIVCLAILALISLAGCIPGENIGPVTRPFAPILCQQTSDCQAKVANNEIFCEAGFEIVCMQNPADSIGEECLCKS